MKHFLIALSALLFSNFATASIGVKCTNGYIEPGASYEEVIAADCGENLGYDKLTKGKVDKTTTYRFLKSQLDDKTKVAFFFVDDVLIHFVNFYDNY